MAVCRYLWPRTRSVEHGTSTNSCSCLVVSNHRKGRAIYGFPYLQLKLSLDINRISGVVVSMLASSAVNRGFETPGQVKPKTEIGICCFSAKHEALKRKSKVWLDQKQDIESEWGNMSTGRMLFQ